MGIFRAALTWVEKETGIAREEVISIEPEVLAFAKNLLASITPTVKQAAENAVLAAVSMPGTGMMKAAAALAAATAELGGQGVQIVANDLKAAIQMAYNNLPSSIQSTAAAGAVEVAASSEVTKLASDVTKAAQ